MGYTGVYRPYTPFGQVGLRRSWFRGAMLKKFGPTLSGLENCPEPYLMVAFHRCKNHSVSWESHQQMDT